MIPRSRYNWLVIAVIFLAVINLASLAFIWFGRPTETQGSTQWRGARDVLINDLDLDSAQVKKFDSLRQIHFGEIQVYLEEMRNLKDAFFGGMGKQNDSSANRLAQQIGTLQTRIDLNTYQHFAALRKICNQEQQQKFDRVIGHVLHNMGPGPNERPGGPPRRPRPPKDE
jgi:protein CpxP